MSDTISCPRCRYSIVLRDASPGKPVRCPECQEVFVPDQSSEGIASDAFSPARPRGSDNIRGVSSEAAAASSWPSARRRPLDDDDEDELDYRPSRRRFRPTAAVGLAVRILFIANIFLSVITLGCDFMQYRLAVRLLNLENVPQHEIDSSDAIQGVLAIVHLGLSLTIIIVFLVWFYRAYANQERLGARRLKFSPGWAVGYWFIPIVNLFRPVQAAQEIWRNSDPVAVQGDNPAIVKPRNSTLIGFWWAAWILDNVMGNVSSRTELAVNSPQSLQVASVVSMAGQVITIGASLLAFAVVLAIDSRQAAQAQALAERSDAHWEEDEVAP